MRDSHANGITLWIRLLSTQEQTHAQVTKELYQLPTNRLIATLLEFHRHDITKLK